MAKRYRGRAFRRVHSNERLNRTTCHKCNKTFPNVDMFYSHVEAKHSKKDN